MSFAVRQTIPTTRASKDENLFAGRSTLRAEEKNKDVPKPKNSALQAYLAKNYDGGASVKDGVETTKRKKKKKSAMDAGGAIRIVDQDVSGFNTLDPKARTLLAKRKGCMGDDDDEEEDEAPVIANPEEAEALMRLANKAKSGSGWVPATEAEEAAGKASSSRRYDSPGASPPRRGVRHGSPDASPPRRRARHDSPDASPPRRAVRHSSPDASPPRRRARHDSPDASPPRRAVRHNSLDASPPRRRARHDSPDASPPRRGVRHDSPDASPPRRGVRHDSPDASPPRRGVRHDSPDVSPPRRRARHDSPDASPPRKRARSPGAGGGGGGGGGGAGGSQAMPHRGPPGAGPGPSSAAGPSRHPPHGSTTHHGPPRPPERMGDGTAAGLVSADQLARDIQQQREAAEERRRNAEGRGAQTVYRDKATGHVMTADEALKAKEDDRAKRKKSSIYDEDQTLEWRGGLAQKREAEERRRAVEEEAAKPFHRTNLDDHHDAALRDRVRFGDPFAHLARRKQPTAEAVVAALTERYDVDKLEKSGFKIPQEVPPHSWLKRGVAAPANRYDIRPGRHWDGVDRSNGFEKKMFKHQNLRAAKELEARLWSMGDM